MDDQLSFELNASPLETLCAGLTLQWLFDRHVYVFTAQHSNRELTDTWFANNVQILKEWPANLPLFGLNDFSAPDCQSTTYNRAKSQELITLGKNRTSYVATVLKPGLTLQLSRLFARAVPDKNLHVMIAGNRADGLNWVKHHLDLYLVTANAEAAPPPEPS
jgi:hypothetical protein